MEGVSSKGDGIVAAVELCVTAALLLCNQNRRLRLIVVTANDQMSHTVIKEIIKILLAIPLLLFFLILQKITAIQVSGMKKIILGSQVHIPFHCIHHPIHYPLLLLLLHHLLVVSSLWFQLLFYMKNKIVS